MQKLVLLSDQASIDEINSTLSSDEWVLTQIVSNNQGQWLAVLDDDLNISDDDFVDIEFDEEDDDE